MYLLKYSLGGVRGTPGKNYISSVTSAPLVRRAKSDRWPSEFRTASSLLPYQHHLRATETHSHGELHESDQ